MKRSTKVVLGVIAGLSLTLAGALLIMSDREQRLVLRHEIEAPLPPEVLWAHLEAAFLDSTASPLWPNELETLRSDGLAAGAQVTATYNSLFGTSSHTYAISDFSSGQGFTYRTGPRHPLRGGGRVLLAPSGNGTTLVWTIDYAYRGTSLPALFVRYCFVPRFFAQLAANLRAL